jgi:chemosensory pili system protein ChpA (sensor histidine kinase/response regulator)
MEVATAILLLHTSGKLQAPGTDFAQQVDLMVERLHACIAGRQAAESDLPLLDEMTRRRRKSLIGQVGREIQNNLAQIEQALDAFFRDRPAHELGALDAPLKQVGGALAMLGHFGAVARLRECGERIRQFAAPEYVPAAADFEQVASQLSLIGFFVEALQGGETDFDAYVRRLGGQEAAAETGGEAGAPASLETQLAGQAKATQALAEPCASTGRRAPAAGTEAEPAGHPEKDADLVADRGLGASATAALAALQSGAPVDAALAALAPSAPPVASAAARELAEAGSEAIDAELLAIFLEEAREVLPRWPSTRRVWPRTPATSNPDDDTPRHAHAEGKRPHVGPDGPGRSSLGSRADLQPVVAPGPAATPELMAMIDGEHALFSAWIAELEAGGGSPPDRRHWFALAARLRASSRRRHRPLRR